MVLFILFSGERSRTGGKGDKRLRRGNGGGGCGGNGCGGVAGEKAFSGMLRTGAEAAVRWGGGAFGVEINTSDPGIGE